jgi:hypothetical protein
MRFESHDVFVAATLEAMMCCTVYLIIGGKGYRPIAGWSLYP